MKSKQQLYDDEKAIRADLNRLKDHLEIVNAIKITNDNREQLENERRSIIENMRKLQVKLSDTLDCIAYYRVLERHKGEL